MFSRTPNRNVIPYLIDQESMMAEPIRSTLPQPTSPLEYEMKLSSLPARDSLYLRICSLVFLGHLALLAASCGGSSNGAPPPPAGNTAVTLLLSSTANDQLSQFNINLTSLSLTNRAGKTVNLFTTSQNPEFIHLNGKTEPLLTVSIPQDVYTAANIMVGTSGFSCLTLTPSGGLALSIYGYSNIANPAAVNLPSPITVTGSAMALSLNLQVSQSASFPSQCFVTGTAPFSITPTFDLAAMPLAQIVETGIRGKVISVNPSSKGFTLALAGGIMNPTDPSSANGAQVSFLSNDQTVYQGIGGFSSLTAGQLIDIDATMQPNGAQLATHIVLQDTDPTNLSIMTGPVLQVPSSGPVMFSFGQQDQGYLWTAGRAGNYMPYSLGSADFRISDVANLRDLPFVPRFDAATMFAGQNVYVSTHATELQNYPIYFPATTLTLIRQSINGTILGVDSAGGSATNYRVKLESYELIPVLAAQPGQGAVLTDPTEMNVYVDSHTRLRNTQPLALGSVARFNGLVFNDNGIVRMDCLQVDDGVAVEPPPAPAEPGSARVGQQGNVTTRVKYDHISGVLYVVHQRMGEAKPTSISDVP